MAANNSTTKYSKLMGFLQSLHFPFNNKYEKKGILSNHLILFLQSGQKDRPLTTLSLFGRRYMQTLEKLPHRLPIMKKAMYNTNYIFICEVNCKIPSIQYCTNSTAS